MRQQAQTEKKKKVQVGYKKKIFPHEDSWVLEQAAQECCGNSIPGGFQTLTGQSPEQCGLTSDLALLEQEIGLRPPEAPPAWIILWSYNPVRLVEDGIRKDSKATDSLKAVDLSKNQFFAASQERKKQSEDWVTGASCPPCLSPVTLVSWCL